jgi:capsular exopolysaccharide synthesis family protein
MSYVRIIRKRWRIIVTTTLVLLGLAAVVTMITPKEYSSHAQFFVSTSGGAGDGSNAALAQGNTFTQARVQSYSQLLKTPKLLGPVAKDIGAHDAAGLAGKVSATTPPNTVLIDVSVTDRSPEMAQRIAKSISVRFPEMIADLEALGDSAQSSPVKVTLVATPEVERGAVAPRPSRNIALGLVLGLLLGLGLAVLKDLLDTKVRTKKDVEALTEAPVIGTVPYDESTGRRPLIVDADPLAGRSEAFRTLRTNLQFLDVSEHPRSIVVTSSLAGEGKSSTAANLALALAESGARICAIEADLRRPRLLQHLGLSGSVGLTDVLIGRADLEDVLQPYGTTGLWVLGAGQVPPNPSELLGSTAMAQTLRQLEGRFDMVVIDGTPILPVTDSTVLAKQVGGALLIVGSGDVTKDQLVHAIESLDVVNARVLGVVLNKAPKSSSGGYYDYRYEPEGLTRESRKLMRRQQQAGAR